MIRLYLALFTVNVITVLGLNFFPPLRLVSAYAYLGVSLIFTLTMFRSFFKVARAEDERSHSFGIGIFILGLGLLFTFAGRVVGRYSEFNALQSELGTANPVLYFLAVWLAAFWAPALALAMGELLNSLRAFLDVPDWLDFLTYVGVIFSIFSSIVILSDGLVADPVQARNYMLLLTGLNTLLILIVGIVTSIIARKESYALPVRWLSGSIFLTVVGVLIFALLPGAGTYYPLVLSDIFFSASWLAAYFAVHAYMYGQLPLSNSRFKTLRTS